MGVKTWSNNTQSPLHFRSRRGTPGVVRVGEPPALISALLREAERGVAEAERLVREAARAGDADALDRAVRELSAWRGLLAELGRLIQDLRASREAETRAYAEALRRFLLGGGRLRRLSWTLLATFSALIGIFLQPTPPRSTAPKAHEPPPRPSFAVIIPVTIQPTAGPNAA